MEKYEYLNQISSALFGDVLKCRHRQSKEIVAIKRIQLKAARAKVTLEGKVNVPEDAFLEKRVHYSLQDNNHENILHMKEEFEASGCMHLVLEYCGHGDLYSHVSEFQLTTKQVLRYFGQVVGGLNHLHQLGYAHRDLSLENILLNGEDECKLCDFGLVWPVDDVSSETVGKSFYLAPEVFRSESYVPRYADMWSLGILLFIMVTGVPPFEHPHASDSRYRFLSAFGVRRLLDTWSLLPKISDNVIQILDILLQPIPTKRGTMQTITSHPSIAPYCSKKSFTLHATNEHKPLARKDSKTKRAFKNVLKRLHILHAA